MANTPLFSFPGAEGRGSGPSRGSVGLAERWGRAARPGWAERSRCLPRQLLQGRLGPCAPRAVFQGEQLPPSRGQEPGRGGTSKIQRALVRLSKGRELVADLRTWSECLPLPA